MKIQLSKRYESNCSCYTIFVMCKDLVGWEGGGGGGGTQQSFFQGGSAQRSNHLPFCMPFGQKWYPFCIHFIEESSPFPYLLQFWAETPRIAHYKKVSPFGVRNNFVVVCGFKMNHAWYTWPGRCFFLNLRCNQMVTMDVVNLYHLLIFFTIAILLDGSFCLYQVVRFLIINSYVFQTGKNLTMWDNITIFLQF